MPDGHWWTLDPLGRGIVLLGVDHVSFRGHWCEALGYAPHGRKNEKKYASRAAWADETLGRLKQWGFTLLGAGCDPQLRHRGLAHCEFLGIGDQFSAAGDACDITPNERRPCTAFPNVFHPDFEVFARHVARAKCRTARDDPWLLGHFIDNELAWWGRAWGSEAGLFDAVMKKPAAHTAKTALAGFLAARFDGDIAALNAVFGTTLRDFDELSTLHALPGGAPARNETKRAFLALVAERYFAITTRAIREADPNHLVLGARFAGTDSTPPLVWEIAGRHCDVVTFNVYPMADLDTGRVLTRLGKNGEPVAAHFATFHALARRPLLVTEWSFPALDAGLPSLHGAGQRFPTQTQRAHASRLFAREMLAMPFLLGYDYFMWVDEPAPGVSTANPEDSNYGLINEDGEPYAPLTGMFANLHREAAARRLEPPTPTPTPQPTTTDAPAREPPPPLAVALKAALPTTENNRAASASKRADTAPCPPPRSTGLRLDDYGEGKHKMVGRVTLAGDERTVGQYNAMIRTLDADGRNRWTATRRVTHAAERAAGDGVTLLTLTAAGETDGCAFEVTHRLYQPAGRAWLIAEAVGVRNTGNTPLCLKGLYFRLENTSRKTPPPSAPNVWGEPQSGCWLDTATDLFFGAVAPWGSDTQVHFWLDAEGGQHPDARLELDAPVELAPGAVFTPSAPAYVICAAGRGGAEAWREEIETIKRVLEK